MKRKFKVESNGSFYPVYVDEHVTLDGVWSSEKCWFMPDIVVRITDDKGNSKTYKR